MKQWPIISAHRNMKALKNISIDLLPETANQIIITTMKDTLTSRKKMAQFKFKPTELDEIKDRVYFSVFLLTIVAFALMLQVIGLVGQ
jgi:hypothetical protein